MGLDSYSKRNLDQIRNDSQVVDEIEQMNLDRDLKAKLRESKLNLEMEQIRLERQQEQMLSELNKNSRQSMDTMSFSDINLTSSIVNQLNKKKM